MTFKWFIEIVCGPGPNDGKVIVQEFARFGFGTCGLCGYAGHRSDNCPTKKPFGEQRDKMHMQLALQQELLNCLQQWKGGLIQIGPNTEVSKVWYIGAVEERIADLKRELGL